MVALQSATAPLCCSVAGSCPSRLQDHVWRRQVRDRSDFPRWRDGAGMGRRSRAAAGRASTGSARLAASVRAARISCSPVTAARHCSSSTGGTPLLLHMRTDRRRRSRRGRAQGNPSAAGEDPSIAATHPSRRHARRSDRQTSNTVVPVWHPRLVHVSCDDRRGAARGRSLQDQ
jgi:hypothetical protein